MSRTVMVCPAEPVPTPYAAPSPAALCEARRRGRLRVLAAVVRGCDGEWGFGPAREPGGGTRSWGVLPYELTGGRGKGS